MKHRILTTILSALLCHIASAVDPGNLYSPLLLRRANLQAAVDSEFDAGLKQRAVAKLGLFDTATTNALGAGWLERLNTSTRSEQGEMAVMYGEGKIMKYPWQRSEDISELAPIFNAIATKPTLTPLDGDTVAMLGNSRVHFPQIVPRMAELLALRKVQYNELYFIFKYSTILGLTGPYEAHMTAGDWILMSSSEFSAASYAAMRNRLLLFAMDALKAKHATDESPCTEDNIRTALAPMVTALDQPLFAGLYDVLADLGIDGAHGLDLPRPDYTATVTHADNKALAAKSTQSETSMNGIGTIMFVKGVAGYNAWKSAP